MGLAGCSLGVPVGYFGLTGRIRSSWMSRAAMCDIASEVVEGGRLSNFEDSSWVCFPRTSSGQVISGKSFFGLRPEIYYRVYEVLKMSIWYDYQDFFIGVIRDGKLYRGFRFRYYCFLRCHNGPDLWAASKRWEAFGLQLKWIILFSLFPLLLLLGCLKASFLAGELSANARCAPL